jgi:hypothetical protein
MATLRVPRPSRPILLTIVLTVLLALPAGVVLAVHNFTDVPTGASYHDDVEALVAAGVTSGCGGGLYCPNASVTRGQMAQFLNRLGALDGQEPVVDADTVDGFHAVSFGRAGLRANGTGGVLQFFNKAGGAPTIDHADTGRYEITIPGKNFNVNSNFVGVATLVSGPGSVSVSSIGGTEVLVETFNALGVAADMAFHLVVFDAVP